jgi:hypothetical protein
MGGMTRRLLLGSLVVLVVLAGSTAALGFVSPINPNNRPKPVPGQTNGVLPAPLLVNVAAHCRALRAAGPSLARVFAMARERNIALGADECYRTLAEEVDNVIRDSQPGGNLACVASVGQSANGTPIGHSYHGWGEAVDLEQDDHSLTFGDSGYRYMKQVAGSLGWNHPAFAEPGGSTCPEPWHWEWVGDGGQFNASPVRGDVVALLPSADDKGYATVTGLGALHLHGSAVSHGSPEHLSIAWVIISAAQTPNRAGYWLVGADGGVFTYGAAHFYGSTGNRKLKSPVFALLPTVTGKGYWLVAWDGGVFTFGDAVFHGSTGNLRLNSPVDGAAVDKSGKGYWLVAADGGIFTFGDAVFHGSTGNLKLAQPVVGMAATKTGGGYWLVASDGGVFTFGDAHYYGSGGGMHLHSPAVAITRTTTGKGYWITLADGEVLGFGDAKNFGNG